MSHFVDCLKEKKLLERGSLRVVFGVLFGVVFGLIDLVVFMAEFVKLLIKLLNIAKF